MSIDLPHALASGLLITAVSLGLYQISYVKNAPRWKRVLILASVFFVVLTLFNMIWPYGNPPWGGTS
jgi:hypothetical protein